MENKSILELLGDLKTLTDKLAEQKLDGLKMLTDKLAEQELGEPTQEQLDFAKKWSKQ